MEQTGTPGGEGGGLDFSALLESLGGSGKEKGEGSGPDLSALLGLLGSSGSGGGERESSGGSGGGVDFASWQGMLGGLPRGEKEESMPAAAGGEGGGLPFDPGLITTLSRAMAALREPDRNIQLLEALRPFLEEERRKKVDEAVKILHLMRLAPLLQESGALSKLLNPA